MNSITMFDFHSHRLRIKLENYFINVTHTKMSTLFSQTEKFYQGTKTLHFKSYQTQTNQESAKTNV